MFISVEKAIQLTGRSKNALYRLMSQGRLNYVTCTKGKRHIEVAELRRVYGELDDIIDQPVIDGGEALLAVITQMRSELNRLNEKVDKQNQLLESLQAGELTIKQQAVASVPKAAAQRPEDDPEWPPFITCYADLAKRDEIKAKYALLRQLEQI